VVSKPSGVFRPYAGVSTAVLLFTKGASTERIWCYDMEHDGFSLDDKRQRVPENDIPDLLACWQHRHDPKFQKQRAARLAELQKQIAPLKKERLDHHALIHRLKFEEVVAGSSSLAPSDGERAVVRGDGSPRPSHGRGVRCEGNSALRTPHSELEGAEAELAELQSRIAPLEKEINQLGRQFWVTKEEVVAEKYDLSASRYRQVEQEEVFYEKPAVTLHRMRQLEQVAESDVSALAAMLAKTSGQT
jgi:type I restriction enzyme M protein